MRTRFDCIQVLVVSLSIPVKPRRHHDFRDVFHTFHRHEIDFAAYVPHSALRIYAMGDRGTNRTSADTPDLEAMADIVRESVNAGAVGVATSRVGAHRRSDGESSFDAAEAELHALASGLRGTGAVFQVVPELQHENEEDTREHIGMLARISQRSGVPVTFTMLQSNRYPDRWRKIMQ